jgi:hypothetical protein
MDRPEERLALIELEGRDGRVGRAIDVWQWPVTLGRALDNHIVIDDPHVAAHHARIAPDEQGRVTLTVLESRNGVGHGKQRIASGQAFPLPDGGTTLQMGATRLRLRLPGEVLAAEQPLAGLGGLSNVQLLGVGAALLALMWANHWVGLDPGADFAAWLPALVGLPVALAGWCGIWALMSKLFQHRFDFAGHLRVALPWLLASALIDMAWPQIAAALGSRWLWQLSAPLQALLLALLVRAHLSLLLPGHQRAVNAAVAAFTLVGGGIALAATQRSSDSFSSQPYMSTLPLPALRLAGTVPPATLVQDMAPLADRLAQRVKKARLDDEEDGPDGSSD